MKNKNTAEHWDLDAEILRSIASDLTEVHALMATLCKELNGGGLVHARDLEPVLAGTVPKLRAACDAVDELADLGWTPPTMTSTNPLLM